MKHTQKLLALAIVGLLLAGSLAGCSSAAASGSGDPSRPRTAPDTSAPSAYAVVEDGEEDGNISYEEQFKPYEPFGLSYDAGKNELQYNGKAVRWFEDYYPLTDGARAGREFFNENGVIDVYAVRDFRDPVRFADGSFDPSGKLVGVREFSAEEFAARDIEAIKNPPPIVAITGDPPSTEELENMAKEYEVFGVTYDAGKDQWYFHGETVRCFQDVLLSNGESLTGGKFRGMIRSSWNENGTIDIYTVRDFANLNAFGNGTLTGVEKFSQVEFDEHTQRAAHSGSGFCTVTQG